MGKKNWFINHFPLGQRHKIGLNHVKPMIFRHQLLIRYPTHNVSPLSLVFIGYKHCKHLYVYKPARTTLNPDYQTHPLPLKHNIVDYVTD